MHAFSAVGRSHCGYCTKARQALTSAGIAFTEQDAGGKMRAAVQEATGKTSVPQAFVSGNLFSSSSPANCCLSFSRLGAVVHGLFATVWQEPYATAQCIVFLAKSCRRVSAEPSHSWLF
jgi:glutaredoxin